MPAVPSMGQSLALWLFCGPRTSESHADSGVVRWSALERWGRDAPFAGGSWVLDASAVSETAAAPVQEVPYPLWNAPMGRRDGGERVRFSARCTFRSSSMHACRGSEDGGMDAAYCWGSSRVLHAMRASALHGRLMRRSCNGQHVPRDREAAWIWLHAPAYGGGRGGSAAVRADGRPLPGGRLQLLRHGVWLS